MGNNLIGKIFARKRSGHDPTVEKPATRGYESHRHVWGQQPRDLPPFTLATAQQMTFDPSVVLGLQMRCAPVCSAEFSYQEEDGTWTPGVRAESDEVSQFVREQLRTIWAHIDCILPAQVWGWSAGEVVYRLRDGLIEIDELLPVNAFDARALLRDGSVIGTRIQQVKRAEKGYVDLDFPKTWFHAFDRQPGQVYGMSVLRGAYSPWMDKWMEGGALDVRRLFMHKDAYGGTDIAYPDGSMFIKGKGEVPNRDIAREITEQIVAGGVTSRPSQMDENGNEMWPITRATVPSNPEHILKYPRDLDTEIWRGMHIADDVLSSDSTGAWAGKRIPMAAFLNGLDLWTASIIRDLVKQVLRPIVTMNFGDAWFEVTHRPLADQGMDQQSKTQEGGQPAPAQGPPARMGLDPVEAVGRGVLSAAELVKAARHVIKMSGDGPNVGDTKKQDGKVLVFNESSRWERVGKGGGKSRAAGFASPNVLESLTFDQAMSNLGSEEHQQMRKQFDAIDGALGLRHRTISIVGDWGDGAENSLFTEYHSNQDFDELRYVMAWKGLIADQKAVLAFGEHVGGNDALYAMTVNDTIEGVREVCSRSGVDFRSIAQGDDGKVDLFVVDIGKSLPKEIGKVADHYDITIEQRDGTAEEIGVSSESTRDEARREYNRIIAEYERKFPDRKHYRRPRRMGSSIQQAPGRDAPGPIVIGIGRRPKVSANA